MAGTMLSRPLRRLGALREPFGNILEEFQEMASQAFPALIEAPESWLAPSVDLSETDKTIEVRVDLPGMSGKDIDVQVNNNVLTISGERKEVKEEKGRTFHRVERRAGRFSRSFTLPAAVAESEVAAEYKDGVLTITLPKTEEAKSHKVPVKT